MNLRIPGPTPCPPEVLASMSKQMINHRGGEFAQIIARVTEKLQKLFLTKEDVLILTGSGTGSMEAAIVNTLSPGDRVLSASNGVFGDRFAQMAETFGAQVTRLKFPFGSAVDPQAVDKALKDDPSIKAVLVTHNETSTGVTNDLASITEVIKRHGKLAVVDGISSIGSIALPFDKWKCDVLVSGSQKSWMVPPGLAMVALSSDGWKAVEAAKMPRFYWDFTRAKSSMKSGQTPWTPAVSIFYALDTALDMMLKEGLSNIIARHERLARMTREGVKALGLSLFADEACASNTVTAVKVPEGVDPKKLSGTLREEYKVVVSGGQGPLDGKIFRIGHLGYVNDADIEDVLNALKATLPKVGFTPAAVRA